MNNPSKKSHSNYRADIDGLRAIAVLLVVLDHLGTRVTGGYIGVDVFFVISGYLISGQILSQMRSGRFSLVDFYERRIRRIFPALLVMLLASAIFAFALLSPSELIAFSRSLLAALLSVSNLLFWSQSSYFDSQSTLKPLLHTWSLAVEEQFYIFFPLLLLFVRHRFPNRVKTAVWTLTATTFVIASVWVQRNAAGAFYLAPLRAWELLIGTLVSQRYLYTLQGTVSRNAAAFAGFLLILVPAVRYNAWTTFPGLTALAPCAGAALIIAAGETGLSAVGTALSWRPIGFIGLISYSLYLWHWPLLVFYKMSYLQMSAIKGSWQDKLALLTVFLAVATLSWRFVERPVREGRFRPGRRTLFAIAGTGAAATAALACVTLGFQGFPFRFPPEALAIDRYTNYDFSASFRTNTCFIDPATGSGSFATFNKAICLAPALARKNYLLMGDSHAAQLYSGLVAIFPELNIMQATTAGCKPFLSQTENVGLYCPEMWRYIYGDYLAHNRPDAVMISGRWKESDVPELEPAIQLLKSKGIEVILFGPSIEFDVPLPRLIAMALRDRNAGIIDTHFSVMAWQTDRTMSEIARDRWNVRYISAFENLCTEPLSGEGSAEFRTRLGCPVYAARDVPLLFDADHLVPQASLIYAKTMRARNQLP